MVIASRPKPGPVRALLEDGSLDGAFAAALAPDLAVALYEHMVLARCFDQALVALQRAGDVAAHSSAAGEEAAIVGAAAGMKDEDWIFAGARELGASLWRGVPLAACAHHALGTGHGAGKGRDIASSVFCKAARVSSVSPLVGTHLPHAVGVAWAARMRRDDVAVLALFGDGATSTSDFHAAMNFAGVFRAPLVAFCRNNGWATSLPASRANHEDGGVGRGNAASPSPCQTATEGLAVKAVAYGVDAVEVDGQDVVAVLDVVRRARERAVGGGGATLVESRTSPARPVGTPHDGGAADDPIVRMRTHLDLRGLWSDAREHELRRDVDEDVARAVAEAKAAPSPRLETLVEDVYAELAHGLRGDAAPHRGPRA